jgi:hypothetical protein
MSPKYGARVLGGILASGIAALLIWSAQVKVIVKPHETVAVPLYPGTSDETGVVFTNLTGRRADLTVEAVSGDPLAGGRTAEKGFILLDGTLRVQTSLPPGQYRLLVKRSISDRRMAPRGLRMSSLRAMRMSSEMRFRPAVRSLRRKAGAAAAARRAIVGASPTRGEMRAGYAGKRSRPCLGSYGFDPVNGYVWSVVDRDGVFAVGGRRHKR